MPSVWIDTDMGFDDLAAICVIAASPQHHIAGLSLVAGNAPLDSVARNAAGAQHLFDWRFPIHLGRERPLLNELETAGYVLGPRGMASIGRHLPEAELTAAPMPAWQALAHYIKTSTDGIHILALGPLTNLALLALNEPELVKSIDHLFWMGGGIGGNHTAAAEFNAAVDPEALAIVLNSGMSMHMVGLDTCRQCLLTHDHVTSLRQIGSDKAHIMADLMAAYVNIAGPQGRMACYDPLAAAALIDPALVNFKPAHVTAELHGQATRGMSVIEWRVPRKAKANALVSTQPDASAALKLINDSFARSCQ